MKNILIIMLVICTLFLQTSCASTKKHTQPPGEYSDDPSEIFPCSKKTPPPDLLSPKQIDYLYENDLWNKYYNECINPPTQKEAWIVNTEYCYLYAKPSSFAKVLARVAPGTKIDILGKVEGQLWFSFYLIEYTGPENQVMKGYVADGYVTTEKPKKPYKPISHLGSLLCIGFPLF